MGLLAVGFASAQEGNVGINTSTPQATLEVQPTAANLAGTTNEGLIAPKLTKERIAAIATPVEGTLVYATDATYAGTNSVVAKIDDKGYYFYNGTEWVKVNGTTTTTSTPTSTVIWEDIRYGTSGKQVVTVDGTLIDKTTWFVLAQTNNGSIATSIRLPNLTAADAGRMIYIFKQTTGNLIVQNEDGIAIVSSGLGVTASRGKGYIWDGSAWWPVSY